MILEHIAEESTRSLHLRSAVQCEVLADGEDVADELVISVYTCREAFKVSSVYDTEILIWPFGICNNIIIGAFFL